MIDIDDLKIAVTEYIAGSNNARSFCTDICYHRAVRMELCRNSFDVKHNFRNILAHARNSGKLMHNAVYANAGNRNSRQAGKQYSSQRVAQRIAEASL